ncbi:MAG: hypothetical protein AB8B63_24285 [Granulosicoccus sp.]
MSFRMLLAFVYAVRARQTIGVWAVLGALTQRNAHDRDYQPYRIARADLLYRSGRQDAAIEQLRRAIEVSESDCEKRILHERLTTRYLPVKSTRR